MSKFFKGRGKSQQELTPAIPREIDAINAEYSDLIGKLGIERFKLAVSEKNIEAYTNQLLQVNAEANARNELDAKAKAE